MTATPEEAKVSDALPPVARRHTVLGVVFSDAGGPYFSEVITGFETEALNAREGVLILGTRRLAELDDLALDLAGRIDGLSILGWALPETLIQRIAARGVPVVLIAREPSDNIPTVRVDNFTPTLALTRYLIVHHHYAPLWFLGSPAESPDIAAPWEGFRAAHRQYGLELPVSPIEELGAVAARILLAQIAGHPVTRDTVLPTTNIYRGSCGCHGNA